MRFITLIAVGFLFVFLAIHETAQGHGFELSLNGNQIAAVSEVPTISPHLFVEEFDSFSATELFTDHGGVEAGDDGSIQLPGDTLGVQFLGPIWYSSGGVAQRAGAGLTLNATSYDTSVTPNTILGSVNLTGSTSTPGSFPVIGDDDHSIGWILSGTSIPAGAYGFSYRVTGLKDGNVETPFQPSVPLVVVFSTPGFNGSPAGSLGNAQQAIFNAILQGDFDLNGKLNAADIPAMLAALADLHGYQTATGVPDADLLAIGDLDRSGAINNADLQSLLTLLASGNQSPQGVPEPASFLIAISAIAALLPRQWQRRFGCG